MTATSIITLDQALQRGEPTWSVRISPFGQIVADNLAISPDLAYPPTVATIQAGIRTVAGVMIGPRSTVDRCWVVWDPQVLSNAPDTPIDTDFFRRLSIDTPLLFSQAGNEGRTAVLKPISALRFFATSQALSGTDPPVMRLSDDNGTVAWRSAFLATAVGTGAVTSIVWPENSVGGPQLELLFLLVPSQAALSTKRFHYSIANNIIGGIAASPVYTYVRSFPVSGRRRVRLCFEMLQPPPDVATYDFIVSGMNFGNDGPNLTTVRLKDYVLATATGMNASNARSVNLIDPNVDVINVYATRTAGVDDTILLRCDAWD